MEVLPNSRGEKKGEGRNRWEEVGGMMLPIQVERTVKMGCWQLSLLFDLQVTRSLLPAPVHL